MDVYNKKGWMQPRGRLLSSLRTYGEIFGNALGTNEANTLNTTDLPKDLSEIKTEWELYGLLGNYAYEIKIDDNPIRDLIKVDIKYGQIVEGGPHVWYYVFKRADMEHVQFIVSPWYVKKYNDLKKHPTMTYSQITKECSEYAVQQQELAAQMSQEESGITASHEDPMAGLNALLAEVEAVTGAVTPWNAEEFASRHHPDGGSIGAAASTKTPSRVQLSAGRYGGIPLLPQVKKSDPVLREQLIEGGHMTVTPGGELGGSFGGGRRRRYTKKRKYTKKRRSSKKRRSKKRRSRRR
jgi:hypothetical protein